jgi:membrane protease YdiL (CAAX protease family)
MPVIDLKISFGKRDLLVMFVSIIVLIVLYQIMSLSIGQGLYHPPAMTLNQYIVRFGMFVSILSFSEEVIYRGLIFNMFKRINFSENKSMVLTSLIFGICHFNGGLVQILFAFCAGLILTRIYCKTGTLGNAILVHSLINTYIVW